MSSSLTLLLLRHGNTFAPGDKVVMVGAGEDLPLVERGREQARLARDSLRACVGGQPLYYAAPLRRTREFAEIIACGTTVHDDKRLCELNYGKWSGLADSEIVARYGDDELRAWRERGKWPTLAGFAESDDEVAARVASFANEMTSAHRVGSRVVAVTSQGVLRYFLRLVPEAYVTRASQGNLAIATGHGAVLAYVGTAWSLVTWNAGPKDLQAHLLACR